MGSRIAKAVDRRIGPWLRSLGDQVECPLCGWTGHRFEPEGVGYVRNRRCPACGAVERHRMLWLHLRDRTDHLCRRTRVLDVAPMPAVVQAMDREPTLDRVGADLSPERRPHLVADLTAVVRSDEQWYCKGKSTSVRPGTMMSVPEPLIAEYEQSVARLASFR